MATIGILLLCSSLLAVEPIVEVEEVVATCRSPNNGAGPLWCYGGRSWYARVTRSLSVSWRRAQAYRSCAIHAGVCFNAMLEVGNSSTSLMAFATVSPARW